MILDIRSVIKARAVILVSAVTFSILTWIPVIDGIAVVFFCFGAFLIPIGAGLLYDHFTPEHEELGERSLGGLLAGGIAGLMFGLLLGLETFAS